MVPEITTGGGGGEPTAEVTKTDTKNVGTGTRRLEVTLRASPGEIAIAGVIEWDSDIKEVLDTDKNIQVSPLRLGNIRNRVSDAMSVVSQRIGVPQNILTDSPLISTTLPNGNALAETKNVPAEEINSDSGGKAEFQFSFQHARIPVIDPTDSPVDEMESNIEDMSRPPAIQVAVTSTTGLVRVTQIVIDTLPDVRFNIPEDIPLSTFVEEVHTSELSCSQLFNSVSQNISELDTESQNVLTDVRNTRDRLEQVRSNLFSVIGIQNEPTVENINNADRDKVLQNVDELIEQGITQQTVEDIDTSLSTGAQTIRRKASSISSSLSGLNLQTCRTQFNRDLNNIQDRADRIDSIHPTNEEMKEALVSLLSDISSDIDCKQEIPAELLRTAVRLESEIEEFKSLDVQNRRLSRKKQLVERANSLRQDAENANITEPCDTQFTSRVKNILSEIKTASVGLECPQKHPQIAERVQQIRTRAASAANVRDINRVIGDARDLAEDIDGLESDRCTNQFATQVDGVIDSLQSRLEGVRARPETRIVTAESLGLEERDTEQDIQNQLDAIQEQLANIQIPEF